MCDRNEVFFFLFCAALAQDFTHCSSDSEQQLTQKDKVLWKGESQGSRQEQGLSTPSVTLVSLQIGFVLVNEGEGGRRRKGTQARKKGRENGAALVHVWIPGTPAMCASSNTSCDLGWSCFFLILLFLFFFFFCLL